MRNITASLEIYYTLPPEKIKRQFYVFYAITVQLESTPRPISRHLEKSPPS